MNVVLDTNVFLVSLPSHSLFHPIFQALKQGHYTLFVTNEVLTEYEEQISIRLGVTRTDLQLRELLNLPNIALIDVFFNWYKIKADPDARNDGPRQVCRLCFRLRSRLFSDE